MPEASLCIAKLAGVPFARGSSLSHSSTTSLTPTTSVKIISPCLDSSEKSCIHGSVRTRTRQKPYWRHSCSRRRTSFVDLALLAWCMLFGTFSALSCRPDIRDDGGVGRMLGVDHSGGFSMSRNPCLIEVGVRSVGGRLACCGVDL